MEGGRAGVRSDVMMRRSYNRAPQSVQPSRFDAPDPL